MLCTFLSADDSGRFRKRPPPENSLSPNIMRSLGLQLTCLPRPPIPPKHKKKVPDGTCKVTELGFCYLCSRHDCRISFISSPTSASVYGNKLEFKRESVSVMRDFLLTSPQICLCNGNVFFRRHDSVSAIGHTIRNAWITILIPLEYFDVMHMISLRK